MICFQSKHSLYKGNFEIIFYSDNPYTNNEEDYLRLSVWIFRGKTKSTLNNYLRDMTTNYKTSFLLSHDYEMPTFNYPKYVLPPVPYNYKTYTKDIWDANTIKPLKTKITAPIQCTNSGYVNDNNLINLFNNEFNSAYYEIEIDLKQIDPTIQSISKFQDAYKTIEISNLSNLEVNCFKPDIEKFIYDRDVNLSAGNNSCNYDLGLLSNITLQKEDLSQTDNINFDNIITLYTDNIEINNIKTSATAYTNGLSEKGYKNTYNSNINDRNCGINFLLQITNLSNEDYNDLISNKIKETYLQAYYNNDLKLKIRFSKVLFINLSCVGIEKFPHQEYFKYWGNDKNIILDVENPNILGFINKSNSPVKITMRPR